MVVALVDVSGQSIDEEKEAELILYDNNGKIVDSTQIENNLGDEGLKVKITMLQTKSIPVEFDTSLIGTASGYHFSGISIQPYSTRLTEENAGNIIRKYDIVVDGCDNFATRYLINDICIEQRKPYVYGAICGFEGQVSVFNYGEMKKSYRDLYPNEEEMKRMPPPPKGVIGVTPAVVGSIEATEVLKIICGFGDILAGKLWTIDLRTLQSNKFSL